MGDAQTLIYRLRFTSTDSALAHCSPLTHPSGRVEVVRSASRKGYEAGGGWPNGRLLPSGKEDGPRSLPRGNHRTGTTGRVVKIRLLKSISRATPVNMDPAGAVQWTEPSKSSVLAFGKSSLMNSEF